ncbi:hypothetical protein PRIPAC_92924 [Pristionchus pacificus]|uniref:Uncharacterized protein n=1 Tax=Pristionchus pacificus TaxID=54126 RepID=A0A2A6BIN3_PRIPA|nr:hypothetical protein PRIPAC_92924 [Pristionchus pacificus]|eukprot:PDM65686.1 hypothetical protein PRIPAC_45600 [Pristionchus pacificus]
MAVQFRQIIKDNNLDSIVEVIQCKIEGIKELPFGVEKVKLFITAIEDRQYKEDKINWWDNVREMAITEPLVYNNQVVTGNYCVKEDALTVKKGEELKGVFTCASNARNERDLDFNIKVSFHGEVCDLEKESTYTLH